MAEYDIDFSSKLVDVSMGALEKNELDFETLRVVLYLSLLSIEISLKSILERAGFKIGKIRECGHDLPELLKFVGRCWITIEFGRRIPASHVRSCAVKYDGAESTVGRIIDSGAEGVSKYPNQIRYGEGFTHYPPQAVLQAAHAVVLFAKEYWDNVSMDRFSE
ncbi:hypothetical protein [Solidesulfovibrio sp.]|uniref:hypothetical protein n=1 Tax=Solidesulfovibrio sp. TaxID=2910990 RepID=UPI002610895E|nr:hypothetical protein [Solidesulfovibrio sp.]